MSGISHPARSDQIAELTRGIKLPFEPLHKLHLSSIAELLVQAWSDLQGTQKKVLISGDEAEINALMETRLNLLIGKQSIWSTLVCNVTRGKETVSFDASHLEKRPDLSIYLTNRNRNFPLVVECKIIETSSGKTVQIYCDKGLVRFVKGEYAWGSREAFMLGYVRDGSSITASLTPILLHSQKNTPDPYCTEGSPEIMNGSTLDLAWTNHSRTFTYLCGPPNDKPGLISLWHLWVSI